MKSFFKKYSCHILIICIGLICLQAMNLLLQLGKQTLIYPDCANYLESAQNLYLKFRGHYYRPLLMAFITGLPYLFGSSDAGIFKWSFAVNVFCWIGTSLILFEILQDYVSKKTAFWWSIIPFLILGNDALNFHLLTENIFTFATILAFWLLFQYYKFGKFWYLSLSLSILLSSMLIKPGAKFFAIIMCLFFIREIIKNYKAKSSIFIYGSILLIAIQVIGMRVQYGNFTISYIDGVTYHNYICSKADCFKNGKEYNQINNPRAEYLFSLNFPGQKQLASEDLKNQIKTNLPNLIKAYFSDVSENSKTGNTCIEDLKNKDGRNGFTFWKSIAFGITKWQNRIFTLLGIFLAVAFLWKGHKRNKATFFVALFIAYIIMVSGISCGQGDRFHLVTVPFSILLLGKLTAGVRRIKPSFGPPQK